jgi:chloramphenicol O-acetyltransferase type A
MEYLERSAWKRREHFAMFHGMDSPHFSLTAPVDVTEVLNCCKRSGRSFYHTMVYLAARTANAVPEFRYRIRGAQVVVHDQVHPSFTYLTRDEVFGFCNVNYTPDLDRFAQAVAAELERLGDEVNLGDEPGRDDLLFITCIPWVAFTQIMHPLHRPADSVPRLAWGKYSLENGRYRLPFSVQAHHALLDGLHVGRYYQTLQGLLDEPEGWLKG